MEAQIVDAMTNEDNTTSWTGTQLDYVDTAFTVVFTLELLINAYAYWFRCTEGRVPVAPGDAALHAPR